MSEYDVPEIEELSLYFGFTVYAEKTGDEDDTYFTLYHVLSNEEFDDVDFEFDWDEDDEEGLKRCFLNYGRCTEKNRLSGRFILGLCLINKQSPFSTRFVFNLSLFHTTYPITFFSFP